MGIPILPVFGRIKGGRSLYISLLRILSTKMPKIANNPTYKNMQYKNLKKRSKSAFEDVSEQKIMQGRPIFPENFVMNLVSNLGSFFPYQQPIPIVKNTGNNISKSFI